MLKDQNQQEPTFHLNFSEEYFLVSNLYASLCFSINSIELIRCPWVQLKWYLPSVWSCPAWIHQGSLLTNIQWPDISDCQFRRCLNSEWCWGGRGSSTFLSHYRVPPCPWIIASVPREKTPLRRNEARSSCAKQGKQLRKLLCLTS